MRFAFGIGMLAKLPAALYYAAGKDGHAGGVRHFGDHGGQIIKIGVAVA